MELISVRLIPEWVSVKNRNGCPLISGMSVRITPDYTITQKDIEAINKLITEYYSKGRKYISEELSRYWKWYQPNGNLKDMACREILLKLHRMDIIKLPPSQRGKTNRKKHKGYTQLDLELPPTSLEGKLSDFKDITLTLLQARKIRQGGTIW